jgi:hypothetical protein
MNLRYFHVSFASVKFEIPNLNKSSYIWRLLDLRTLNLDQSSYVLPLLDKIEF